MSKQDRQEQIRRVRSFNDVTVIVESVRREVAEDARSAFRMLQSTPQRMVATAAKNGQDETITFRRGAGPGPVRVTTRSQGIKPTDFDQKIESIKDVPKAVTKKNLSVVQRLYDNARYLDSLEAVLRQDFNGFKSQPAALSGIRKLKKNVDTNIRTALVALNKSAAKHFPPEMVRLGDKLSALLLDKMPHDTYKEIGYSQYVSHDEHDRTLFSLYIEITGLKNSSGMIFPEYFIILTGVVTGNKSIQYYLNALPDFRVPGKYPLGTQVSDARSLEAEVAVFLTRNDVVTDLDKKPLPKSLLESRDFTKISGVKEARIDNDMLYLKLGVKVSKQKQESIMREVIPLLNAAMGRSRGANIVWKPVTRGSIPYIKVTLYYKQGAQNVINSTKLSNVAEMLGFNSQQVEALKHAMLSGD